MKLTYASGKSRQRSAFAAAIFFGLAVVMMVAAILPFATMQRANNANIVNNVATVSTPTVGGARAGFICSKDVGSGMSPDTGWGSVFTDYPARDKSGRQFTVEEAFGSGLGFPNYNGEGEGNFFFASKDTKPPEFVSVEQDRLESLRNWDGCVTNRVGALVASVALSFADISVSLVQTVVGTVFNPNLICNAETVDGEDFCLNISAIIGGNTKSEGDRSIISSLTNSIYFPLLTIAAIFLGAYMGWQGLVKRQFRKAIGGMVWSILIIILGGGMLLNPHLLAKAPNTVSSAAATCIMGAFAGEDCFSGGSTGSPSGDMVDGKSSSDKACQADTPGADLADKMGMTVATVSCGIWKAMVLDPYSIASFGTTFDDLDTKDPSARGSKYVAAAEGVSADDFCVPMGSSRTAKEMKGGTLILDSGNKLCNIAGYQLYLRTDAQASGDNRGSSDRAGASNSDNKELTPYQENWYKLVEVAGNNDGMWAAWTSQSNSGVGKITMSIIALMVSIFATIVIFSTSFFALIYYISGVLLMSFAPLFLLIGVHPGRGKRMMLGWLEKLVSSVLKYLVSAAFVVVTISLYGGIMSASTGLGYTLIFSIVITCALLMYRKEFVEMMGKVNMGGEQLSNRFGDKVEGFGPKVMGALGNNIQSGAGAAVGSKLAGGSATGGFKSGFKRNMKRGNSVIANATREYDNVGRDNLNKMVKQNSGYKEALREGRDAMRGTGRPLVRGAGKTAGRHGDAAANALNLANDALGVGQVVALVGAPEARKFIQGRFNREARLPEQGIAQRIEATQRILGEMGVHSVGAGTIMSANSDMRQIRSVESELFKNSSRLEQALSDQAAGLPVTSEQISAIKQRNFDLSQERRELLGDFEENYDSNVRSAVVAAEVQDSNSVSGTVRSNLQGALKGLPSDFNSLSDEDKEVVTEYNAVRQEYESARAQAFESAGRDGEGESRVALDKATERMDSFVADNGGNSAAQAAIIKDDIKDVDSGYALETAMKYNADGAVASGIGMTSMGSAAEMAKNPNRKRPEKPMTAEEFRAEDTDRRAEAISDAVEKLEATTHPGSGASRRKAKKALRKEFEALRDEEGNSTVDGPKKEAKREFREIQRGGGTLPRVSRDWQRKGL